MRLLDALVSHGKHAELYTLIAFDRLARQWLEVHDGAMLVKVGLQARNFIGQLLVAEQEVRQREVSGHVYLANLNLDFRIKNRHL